MQRLRVSDIREEFLGLKSEETHVIDKTNCRMLEIQGASFLADENAIFGKVNWDYVDREIKWYESMSLNVNDIPGDTPAIWKQVADPDGHINSNYGWMIWSASNGYQYEHVLDELRENPFSRRAVMIYQHPNMWLWYNLNGRSDFCCTNVHQYLIRDDKLHVIVQMRSNDVVFGYKNDRAWASHVLTRLAGDLQIERGDIIWQVGSLHVYERHFHLVK